MYAPDLGPRGILVFFGVLLGIGALTLSPLFAPGKTSSADSVAHAIVQDCSQHEGDHSACYEEELPALYPALDLDQIFDVIRAVRAEDISYQYCHVAAHKIGERVVAEDPDKWVDALPLNPPDGLCSNGFIHGVIGGRFRAEVLDEATINQLLPDFIRACEPRESWQPSGLDRGTCYHGMGHLYDFITDADLDRALDLCSRTTPRDYTRLCMQGVFMQIYQPLEPDDFALIERMRAKPEPGAIPEFCARFDTDQMAQGACLVESWHMILPQIIDGTGVEPLCSSTPNQEEEDICYVALSSVLGRMSLGNPEQVDAACSEYPAAHIGTCYSYSAEAVLEEDRTEGKQSVALCRRAPKNAAEECIALLADHADFVFGSDTAQRQAFCDLIPAELQRTCRAVREF